MPRPRTGAPRWSARLGCWVARLGTDRRPVPLKGVARDDKEGARLAALAAVEEHEAGGYVPPGTGKTVAEWFVRWVATREARGLRSGRVDHCRFRKWIDPHLGLKPIAEVTRRDVEAFVQAIDSAVQRHELSWKTAQNAWNLVTKMFRDSCRSKVLELRVREDNPAQEVEGPYRGAERDGPYLYPREFSALMDCRRVPARWKRVIAIVTFLYLRGGELEALDWSAVNLELGYVHIHQSFDSDSRKVKTTKTKRNRKVPIEPTLMPLLAALHEAAGGTGRVLRMPQRKDWAKRLRKYLGWALADAGIKPREDLFADDETRRPMSFHDLRHTGISWRAIRGDDPLKIQRAAGHDDLRTTQRYIEEAETFDREAFGSPFPSLPELPAVGGNRAASVGNRARTKTNRETAAILAASKWPLRGSNPHALSSRGF